MSLGLITDPPLLAVSISTSDWSDYLGSYTITSGGPGAAISLTLLRVIDFECSFPFLQGFTSKVLGNEP